MLLILESEKVVSAEGLSEERRAGEDSVQRYRSTLPVYVREWLRGWWMLGREIKAIASRLYSLVLAKSRNLRGWKNSFHGEN
jgi:hypothetical protein